MANTQFPKVAAYLHFMILYAIWKKHELWSGYCQTKVFLLKMPSLRALLATGTYMQPRHVPMIVLLHACVAQYLGFNAGFACTPRAPFFKRKIPKRLLFLLLPMCFKTRDSTCKPGQPCGNRWEYTEYVTLERLHLDIPPQSCAGLTLTRTIWTWPTGHLVSSKHLSLWFFFSLMEGKWIIQNHHKQILCTIQMLQMVGLVICIDWALWLKMSTKIQPEVASNWKCQQAKSLLIAHRNC